MLTSVIIEDLPNDLEVVKKLLSQHYPDTIRLAGTASTVATGITLLEETKPSLVFLDVELGDHLSFEMFSQSKALRDAQVIFTTGHSKYVELAFDMNALSYILKPVGSDRFKKVVDTALLAGQKKVSSDILQDLPQYFNDAPPSNPRILLRGQRESRFTYLKDIELAEADANCSKFWYHQRDGQTKEFTTTTNLGEYERMWKPYTFIYRIGRKHIVNLMHVDRISNITNHPTLHLTSGKEVAIPTGKIRDIEQAIADLSQND